MTGEVHTVLGSLIQVGTRGPEGDGGELFLVVGEVAPPSARRRAAHDHTAALTGCFASRQPRSLARPVRVAAVFGPPMAKPCVLQTGCRVPLAAKEPRTAVRKEDTMTADALKKITTDALDTLAALLDEGHSEQLTALLKTMARFHKYSWHNVALIASQRPTATRVAGFQTWRSLGRFVRKGEKGIAILAPIVRRREAESESDNARTVFGFRVAHVFDCGADGRRALAEPIEASGDPGDKTALLKAAILEQGIAVESVDDLGGALGTSSGEGIRLLNGLSPAMEFTTLVHEYAHELMHTRRRPTHVT